MAAKPLDDAALLRRSFDVAKRSRANGDHPIGALLVAPTGEVLREQGGSPASRKPLLAGSEKNSLAISS